MFKRLRIEKVYVSSTIATKPKSPDFQLNF